MRGRSLGIRFCSLEHSLGAHFPGRNCRLGKSARNGKAVIIHDVKLIINKSLIQDELSQD